MLLKKCIILKLIWVFLYVDVCFKWELSCRVFVNLFLINKVVKEFWVKMNVRLCSGWNDLY